jgi:hypothetical protein
MSTIGKSLVFYFKFWFEMQRLYEETDGVELEGLSEPERIRRMARAVGDKAHSQAADFLEACTEEVKRRFDDIGKTKEVPTSGKSLEKSWSTAVGICPKDKQIHGNNWRMLAGVEIRKSETPEIIPWIWRKGGEHSEDQMAAMLGDKVKGRSQDLDLRVGTGSVALDKIPLLPDNLGDEFDVDRDALIQRVRLAFEKLTQQNLNLLYPK